MLIASLTGKQTSCFIPSERRKLDWYERMPNERISST